MTRRAFGLEFPIVVGSLTFPLPTYFSQPPPVADPC